MSRTQAAPRIVVRSSWQVVNIGDIAHTPGLLAVLQRHLPEAHVTLWATSVAGAVRGMIARRFPHVAIVDDAQAGAQAVAACDLLVHGSGPGLPGADAARLAHQLGKPLGFAGITLGDDDVARYADLLAAARFVFTRETASLALLRKRGITPELAAFGPDASFAFDLRDEQRAERTLGPLQLDDGGFLCVVPRLRWTPYWDIHPESVAPHPQRIAENQRHAEPDHAKLRAAIVAWVQATGRRVLLAPEMGYAVPLLRPLLFDGLPAAVRGHVAALDRFWLPDEAASVYARAAAVLSLEMHSPILAIAAGTPALHVRQPTDTRKGQMWRDVGLGDWLFDVESVTDAQLAARVVEVGRDAPAARAAAAAARDRAAAALAQVAAAIARCLGVMLCGPTTPRAAP